MSAAFDWFLPRCQTMWSPLEISAMEILTQLIVLDAPWAIVVATWLSFSLILVEGGSASEHSWLKHGALNEPEKCVLSAWFQLAQWKQDSENTLKWPVKCTNRHNEIYQLYEMLCNKNKNKMSWCSQQPSIATCAAKLISTENVSRAGWALSWVHSMPSKKSYAVLESGEGIQ